MKESWLDTNVILRYLLGDHPEQSARSRALIAGAAGRDERLKVAPLTVAELVYVLEGSDYRYSSADVYAAMVAFSREPAVHLEQGDEVVQALADYRDHGVDFVDALLMALARRRGERVWTFNVKHFQRLDGDWAEPTGAEPPN